MDGDRGFAIDALRLRKLQPLFHQSRDDPGGARVRVVRQRDQIRAEKLILRAFGRGIRSVG
jgi:hypothetical protein